MDSEELKQKPGELSKEALDSVNGGYLDEFFMYQLGDRVKSVWHRDYGVGEVVRHVGIVNNAYIDEVHFDSGFSCNLPESELDYA